MTGFELWAADIGSDRSTNLATTTAPARVSLPLQVYT